MAVNFPLEKPSLPAVPDLPFQPKNRVGSAELGADENENENRRLQLSVFSQDWMNSCLNETALPGSAWHRILDRIVPGFVRRLKGQFGDSARKEAIFHLLGFEFVNKYLHEEKRDGLALASLSHSDRRQLVRDTADWLNSTWRKAAEEANCQRVPMNEDVDPVSSPEMADFMTHVYRIFYVGLDRHMYEREAKDKKKNADSDQPTGERPQIGRQISKSDVLMHKRATGRLSTMEPPNVNFDALSTARSVAPSEYGDLIDKKNIRTQPTAAPPLTSQYSDGMGVSVIAFLQRDPRKLTDVVSKLHGRQLPKTLRVFIWLEALLRKERNRGKQLQAERLARENFGRAISRGLGDLNVKKPTNSPIASIIDNAISETYRRLPGLVPFCNESHMHEAAEVLNVVYVSDRSYEAHLILWVFPIQLAFEDASHLPEHPLDLALYLHLFKEDVFPGWDESHKVAERIVKKIVDRDEQLAKHLENICRRRLLSNKPTEPKKEEKSLLLTGNPTFVKEEGLKVLEPIVTIMYSWVSEGFVGVLDGNGVLFAWDQLMMFGWNSRIIENLALAIIMLLRHRFLESYDFEGIQEILIQEPGILYTVDLQAAFVFLEHNDDLTSASKLNRQKAQLDEGLLAPLSSRNLTNLDAELPRFGLRDLEIQLIIPNTRLKQYRWLYDLDVTKFRIILSSYFGAVHMANYTNSKAPFAKDSLTNTTGDLMHTIRFHDEFVGGPFQPRSYLSSSKEADMLRRSGGNPNIFMALVYEGDFPMKSEETQGALFGWTQIGAWVPSEDSRAWKVPNDVKWYSLQTSKMPLALAPLAALADKKILIDTEYSSHFSHMTVEIFNPVTVPLEKSLFKKMHVEENKIPDTLVVDELPPIDFVSVRQTVPPLPPSGGWIRHHTTVSADEEPSFDYMKTFDFYVDGIRFLPDNATITAVHINFAHSGSVSAPENFVTLSHLESAVKLPYYNGKVVINEKGRRPTKDMVAILTVIAVDKISTKSHVLGIAMCPLFETIKKGREEMVRLRVGGHQFRLIASMPPEIDKRLNTIREEHKREINSRPRIPATTILVRLLPHEDRFADVPLYTSGYYKNEETFVPTPSEEAIMTVAMEEDRMVAEESKEKHAPTVRDACHYLMVQRGETPGAIAAKNGYSKWMQQRLLKHSRIPSRLLSPADYLLYSEMAGVAVKFERLINVKTDSETPAPALFLFVRCQLFPNSLAQVAQGTREDIYALEMDPDSPISQPAWLDPVQTIFPVLNKSVVLVFEVFRFNVDYIVPQGEKNLLRAGALRSRAEPQNPPTASDLIPFGWSVVPIFKNHSVFEQIHLNLPLIPGAKPADSDSVLSTFVKQNKAISADKGAPNLVVSIVDGRKGTDVTLQARQEGTTVRQMLTDYISKSALDPDRVKWHVECCIRKVASQVITTFSP